MKKIYHFTSKFFTKDTIYESAAKQCVYIIEENLGEQIAGYYNNTFGEKLIHVNSTIPSYYKNFVIAYFLSNNYMMNVRLKIVTICRISELINSKQYEDFINYKVSI